MSVLNNVMICGRLTKDVDVRQAGETTIARTTVAVTRDYKNKDGEYDSDFIPIIAFGKTAEFIEKFFSKGKPIAVTGSIQTGSYTNKDGQKVYTTEVAVDKATFVPGVPRDVEDEAPAKKTTKKPAKTVDPDDDFMNISPEEASKLPW